MTPQKPYLLRAIYEWILDNQCTPYLLVNTEYDGVQVPQAYIQDGRIVLNISPDAIHQLSLNNDWVSFSARFAGQAEDIFIPIKAVQAIYCKENNEGMFFPEEEQDPPPDDKPSGNDTHSKGRPSLKVIK